MAWCALCALIASARGATNDRDAQLREIIEQNRRLQEQVGAQQRTIEQLSSEIAAMRQASERHERELRDLQARADEPVAMRPPSRGEAKVRVWGEGGLAFFRTGRAGAYPNSEFRVDDAKVGIEAQVWRDTFAFAEFNLLTRETNDEAFHLGEFYLDAESLFGDRLVNLRAGRINIPFGEEYQKRGVIDNPLISHSVTDIWGVDEGVEVYGEAGRFQYVVAVQNGGHSLLHDYDSDKMLTARVGFDPNRWVHLSASALRTGDLSAKNDSLSEMWFANGFFRALGSATTTQTFAADVYEIDAIGRWSTGHLAAAAGWANFNDDDTTRSNARKMNYHSIEALQRLGENFYGVARYSAIRAPKGYPLVGLSTFGAYFYSGLLTEKLERLSLGFGYRFGPPLVLKFEYAFERGRLTSGAEREHEDLLSTEIGLKF
jgi:hypothetical protein